MTTDIYAICKCVRGCATDEQFQQLFDNVERAICDMRDEAVAALSTPQPDEARLRCDECEVSKPIIEIAILDSIDGDCSEHICYRCLYNRRIAAPAPSTVTNERLAELEILIDELGDDVHGAMAVGFIHHPPTLKEYQAYEARVKSVVRSMREWLAQSQQHEAKDQQDER